MASKRAIRNRQCRNKKQYETPDEADRACRIMLATKGERMHKYHCQFCKRYHIGHPNKASRKAFAVRTGL